MDAAAFRTLVTRTPFGSCSDDEWAGIADHLLASLSGVIGMPLEFVGTRRPDGDNFAPLVRSVGVTPLGVRLGGMIACSADRESGLRIYSLMFVFVAGERVAPDGLRYLTADYLGPDELTVWTSVQWGTSEFPDEYESYTYHGYFEGAEAELPGCEEPPSP